MSHILLVEDELAIAEAVQSALAKAGHSVNILAFGELALKLFDVKEGVPGHAYDLIILDVGLPDLNGFEVCRQIRLLHSAQDLPILFLTAHNEEIDRVLGLELSGGDYLTKPFSLRELVTRVRLLLGRRQENGYLAQKHSINEPAYAGQEQTPLRAARHPDAPRHKLEPNQKHLGFEWNEHEAWVAFRGQRLALTITEYRLLIVFLRSPKQVFSRQQLLNQSRGETHPSGERTIDTHIKSLRAKLREKGTEADIITTHRGLGYSSH